MAAWFYNAVSTAATTLPLGVHLYWQEWSSELLPYWLGTYAVLLMSWLAPCVFFEALERTGATAKWRLQPNKSPLPDSVKAQALRCVSGGVLVLYTHETQILTRVHTPRPLTPAARTTATEQPLTTDRRPRCSRA